MSKAKNAKVKGHGHSISCAESISRARAALGVLTDHFKKGDDDRWAGVSVSIDVKRHMSHTVINGPARMVVSALESVLINLYREGHRPDADFMLELVSNGILDVLKDLSTESVGAVPNTRGEGKP